MSSLGERINHLRVVRKGLTLEQLASQLSIPVYQKDKIVDYKPITSGTLSNLENNKHRPNVDIAIVLSDFFGVSVDWLLRGEDFPEKTIPFNQMKLQDLFASMTPEQLEAQERIIKEMRKKALGDSE